MKETVSIKTSLQAIPVNTTLSKQHAHKSSSGGLSFTATSSVNDNCSGQWTNDKLVGRCFGLKNHVDYPSLKDIPIVPTADHCKKMCCDLGSECISWQYWVGIKLCKLGGAVRVGIEASATPNWCEPEPPIVWSGRKVHIVNGTRSQGEEELTTQCFGLGPQKFRMDGENKVLLTSSECSAACMADPKCGTWQAHENRGCFYASAHQIYCEPYDGSYDGGRKKLAPPTGADA
jgi:hypothetical protein